MANPLRGEVGVPGTVYVLRYDVNALCEIEAESGVPLPEIIAQLESAPRLAVIRQLFWYGLRAGGHPALSEMDAGKVIDGIGFRAASTLIGEAMRASNLFEGDAPAGEA